MKNNKVCKWEQDEICVNDQCPMLADFCPVPDTPGVCRYEERIDEQLVLTPMGCLIAAFMEAGVDIPQAKINEIFDLFAESMDKHGYIKHEEETQ